MVEEIDWKMVLLWDVRRGDGDGEKLARIVTSLQPQDLIMVLKLITTNLGVERNDVLWRYNRRLKEEELYGSALLQERLVRDLYLNHPMWKRLDMHSVHHWHKWCNQLDETIGTQVEKHLTNLYPAERPHILARPTIAKLLLDQTNSTSSSSKELVANLKRIDRNVLENTIAGMIALQIE